MSRIRRKFEDWLYETPAIDAFDYMVDNGWDEDDALELLKIVHG